MRTFKKIIYGCKAPHPPINCFFLNSNTQYRLKDALLWDKDLLGIFPIFKIYPVKLLEFHYSEGKLYTCVSIPAEL